MRYKIWNLQNKQVHSWFTVDITNVNSNLSHCHLNIFYYKISVEENNYCKPNICNNSQQYKVACWKCNVRKIGQIPLFYVKYYEDKLNPLFCVKYCKDKFQKQNYFNKKSSFCHQVPAINLFKLTYIREWCN